MNVSLWCLVVGCFLPYIWSTAAIVARGKQPGGLDNNHPRIQMRELTGWGARAAGAHANAWEALAVFTPAVLLAFATAANPVWVTRLSIGWVIFRVLHGVCYLADIDKARTAAFSGALLCSCGLFASAAGWL